MALVCSVCSHPDRQTIDAALLVSESMRDVARRFHLDKSAVSRHKLAHLSKSAIKALAKRHDKPADVFMDRIEFLWDAAKTGVQDAQEAVRTVTDDDGKERIVGRDLTALAPLLSAAHRNVELLGKATGRLSEAAASAQSTHIVILGGQVAIDQRGVSVDSVDSLGDSVEAKQIEDGIETIDVKALGNS